MQQIVLISGLAGSGKSTCSHALYERLSSVALVEADAIIKVKPWEAYEQLRTLGILNGAALIQNYWDAGYSHIVCSGLVWNQNDVDFLCAQISGLAGSIVLFWLQSDKEERHERKKMRNRDAADLPDALDAVDAIVAGAMPTALPSGRIIKIDTTGRTPVEVVQEITAHIAV